MSSIIVSGDTSGSVTLSAPAVSGTTTLTLPTTSGTITTKDTNGILSVNGVQFPATQSASADANTLDDYEEGTWTPTIGASSTNPSGLSYSTQFGRYTKIGNVVYAHFRVQFSFTNGTGSGSLEIRGLPFTSNTNPQPKSPPQQDNITFTGFTYLEMGVSQNTALINLGANRSGASAGSIAIGSCASGGTDINGGVFYFI